MVQLLPLPFIQLNNLSCKHSLFIPDFLYFASSSSLTTTFLHSHAHQNHVTEHRLQVASVRHPRENSSCACTGINEIA